MHKVIVRSRITHRNSIDIFKYLSILLIILFIFFIPSVIKKMIKINKIECSSQFGTCTKSYQLGDYSFVKKQIEADLNKDIQVSSYLIQYKIPSTIKIDLSLKRPKYAIKNLSNDIYFIDKDGLVLTNASELNFLYLTSDTTYTAGQKISDKEMFSLKLLEKVKLINNVTSAEIKKGTLELKIDDRFLVKFPIEGDIDVLVGSLRLIFSRLNENSQGIKIENTVNISDVREIDLRFKNPVLR